MRLFLISTTLIFCYQTIAQSKHANNWYFGNRAGVTFNTSPPEALVDGQIQTDEGCSSVSDDNGNLLFYSEGKSVWNREHNNMSNGYNLFGHFSSTQSCLIVKKPGDNSIYVLFTVDYQGEENGMRYSEVDMALNGGLGNVNQNKNVLIVTPTCEKIAAVAHANGQDFWIICHLNGSNIYQSYLLSENGINLSPVESSEGITINTSANGWAGQLKASPNGSMIAAAHQSLNSVELFQFDNAT